MVRGSIPKLAICSSNPRLAILKAPYDIDEVSAEHDNAPIAQHNLVAKIKKRNSG